jgi:hypothetical protein
MEDTTVARQRRNFAPGDLGTYVCFDFNRAKQSEDRIIIAYSGLSGFQGPLWAYKEMALFQKYGLSPEIILIGGGTQSMQTLLSAACNLLSDQLRPQ